MCTGYLVLTLAACAVQLNAQQVNLERYIMSISSIEGYDDVIVQLPMEYKEIVPVMDTRHVLRMKISLLETQHGRCEVGNDYKVWIGFSRYRADHPHELPTELNICGHSGEKTWFTVIGAAGNSTFVCGLLKFFTPETSTDGLCSCMEASANFTLLVCTRRRLNPATDVSLYLYSHANKIVPDKIQVEKGYVPTTFNATAETRFVIHGWNSSVAVFHSYPPAYLTNREYINLVLVDWARPASGSYIASKSATLEVGTYLAEVINYLVSNHYTSVNKIQLVGHSLGAHVAGIVGHALGGVLPLITGLDPAAPLYDPRNVVNRLDVTDARFVQVIHTSGNVQGWEHPIGNVDFYPNGGISPQPGCGADSEGSCSHSRAREYFAESITSTKFIGHRCSSYSAYTNGSCDYYAEAIMGEHVSVRAISGSYFLKTASSPPYAIG